MCYIYEPRPTGQAPFPQENVGATHAPFAKENVGAHHMFYTQT